MTHRVLTVSGSLRAASSNTGLIRVAQRLAPAGLDLSDPYPIRALPYYDGDLDTPETLPEVCRAWRADVAAADALLIAAPEYNHGPSGVLKNAIDWASRPFGAHVLTGKVVSVMTSAGPGGGGYVLGMLEELFGLLGCTVVDQPAVGLKLGMLSIAPDGTTTDPQIDEVVADRLAHLAAALDNR